MEYGSFIELQFPKGKEYYKGENAARLNSGRAAILHAARLHGCKVIYLPQYQCGSVKEFLMRYGIEIRYYQIDSEFTPCINANQPDSAMLIVNYFGIMSRERLRMLSEKYQNVIIDNSQAFFAEPILENRMGDKIYSVYSARKFFGVPDGAYVIGKDALAGLMDYERDYSSDTSLFLLQRIEYGCEGIAYQERIRNEARINNSGIKRMSLLTHTILDGTDYSYVARKRKENFRFVAEKLNGINALNVYLHMDKEDGCVPMVYPLVALKDGLLEQMIEKKHFQGPWWAHLLKDTLADSMEYTLSKYMIPVTIDQRYQKSDLLALCQMILKLYGEEQGEIYESNCSSTSKIKQSAFTK